MNILRIIKGVILVLAIWGGISIWKTYGPGDEVHRSNSEAQREINVQRMDFLQRVTIAGNVVPERKTIVTAPFSGHIKKLYVKIGQQIKKGDPLVSVVQSLQSTDPVYPLRAPFDGTVVSIQKYEGEFVKRDDPKEFILRVDSLKNIFINSNVPEIDAVKIKVGQEAIIKASAILDRKYKGLIKEVSMASVDRNNWSNQSKVEFSTRIQILNADQRIRPGMSAILDIVTLRKEKVLVLPHEFLLEENNDFFVLDKEGNKRKVVVGVQNESFFEIKSGVTEGETVKQIDFIKLFSK